MKVYIIEFSYFDAAEWKYIQKTIKALSKIQLIRAFLDETKYAKRMGHCKSLKECQKYIWNKSEVVQSKLVFPLIEYDINY